MDKLSFIEKLGILVDVSLKSKIFLLILVLLVFLGIALVRTNKINEKQNKFIYLGVTLSVLLFVIISYHDSLGKMITYMMNNFFIAAFFPNLAVYMAALIATNIILWVSIFSYKTAKQIKILNVVMYIIMNYLLALILSTVKTNSLDIFSQSAVYENKNASALISLSSTIFIIWIVFLVIYKILLIYLRKDYKPKVKKVIVKRKVKKLPKNFLPLDSPTYIYKKNNNVKTSYTNDILTSKMDSIFTLEDYKLLLKMLNEQKKKEKQEQEELEIIDYVDNHHDIVIEDKKEEIKEVKPEEDEQIELKKYNELLELYKMN